MPDENRYRYGARRGLKKKRTLAQNLNNQQYLGPTYNSANPERKTDRGGFTPVPISPNAMDRRSGGGAAKFSSYRGERIYEDDPQGRWNPQTMGNKRGKRSVAQVAAPREKWQASQRRNPKNPRGRFFSYTLPSDEPRGDHPGGVSTPSSPRGNRTGDMRYGYSQTPRMQAANRYKRGRRIPGWRKEAYRRA